MDHSPEPENLVALFRAAVGDPASRARLARAVFPDEDAISAAIVEPAARRRLIQGYASMRPPDEAPDKAWAKVLDVPPTRTKIQAFGAIASDIAAPEPGTRTASEFPGGLRELAHLLAPETVFYEVTATEPESSSGSRFHLFFWHIDGWRMLGPIWRVLR